MNLFFKVLERALKLQFDDIVKKLIRNFDFEEFVASAERNTEESLTGWTSEEIGRAHV